MRLIEITEQYSPEHWFLDRVFYLINTLLCACLR